MKLPKIHLRTIIFSLAVIVLVVSGVIWKYGFFNAVPIENPTTQFITSVDRGFSAEDLATLEKKVSDQENKLATDSEFAGDLSQWLILGNLKYQLGDLAGAKEVYEIKILKDYPDDAAALENLAQTLYEMGDYAGAELRWRAAISVSPWEVTYIKLADLIENKFPTRQKEIQGILEEAIANLGQSTALLCRLGDWYSDNQDYERALSHYEVAKQLSSDDESIDLKIAEVRKLMNQK